MNGPREPLQLTFQSRGGWLQRALITVAALSLAVVAFFFITIALIAAAFIALVVGIRWWWALRHLRAQVKAAQPIDGEYTVIEHAPRIEREPRR